MTRSRTENEQKIKISTAFQTKSSNFMQSTKQNSYGSKEIIKRMRIKKYQRFHFTFFQIIASYSIPNPVTHLLRPKPLWNPSILFQGTPRIWTVRGMILNVGEATTGGRWGGCDLSTHPAQTATTSYTCIAGLLLSSPFQVLGIPVKEKAVDNYF